MRRVNVHRFFDRPLANHPSLNAFVAIAIVSWIAHFFHFRDFGLYEDDYAFIADAMGRKVSYLIDKLQYFTSFSQGRPVGFYCAALLAFAGDKLGGLQTDYLFAYAIVTLNSYLFYRILKRTDLDDLALIGALSFCLFPADTTKILLTHAFILQTSLTFLLVATLCFLSNRKLISYFVILGSLLSYESAFMVFFGVPLLKQWNRGLVKELGQHSAILTSLIACTVVIRKLTGEERIVGLLPQLSLLPQKILGAITIGPNVSLSLFVTAPLRAIAAWDTSSFIAGCVCLMVIIFSLQNTKANLLTQTVPVLSSPPKLKLVAVLEKERISIYHLKVLKLFLTGIVLLCLSYSLAFTYPHYPPTAEVGRLTSVHLAATVGGSIVFACLASLMISAVKRRSAISVLALYFSCLVSYQFTIQKDFVQSWQNQRTFWSEVIANTPDLDQQTTVFVSASNLPETTFILTHSWADPLILKQLYQFSEIRSSALLASDVEWDQPPTLFLVPQDWRSQISLDGQLWSVPLATWRGYSVSVSSKSTVILEQRNGHLTRLDKPITVQGRSFGLKSKSDAPTGLKPGVLFNDLIESGSRSSVSTSLS